MYLTEYIAYELQFGINYFSESLLKIINNIYIYSFPNILAQAAVCLGKMPTAAEAEQLLEHAQNNPTLTKFEQVV